MADEQQEQDQSGIAKFSQHAKPAAVDRPLHSILTKREVIGVVVDVIAVVADTSQGPVRRHGFGDFPEVNSQASGGNIAGNVGNSPLANVMIKTDSGSINLNKGS